MTIAKVRKPPRGYVTPQGYRRIRLPGSRRLRMEHVVVWEQHHGTVPLGMDVHHINGNKLDNRIENLALLTRLEHKRIHSGCLRINGDWLKRCRRCRWFKSIATEFYVYPGGKGAMSYCRRCTIDLAIARKQQRRRERAARVDGAVCTNETTPAVAAGVGEGEGEGEG